MIKLLFVAGRKILKVFTISECLGHKIIKKIKSSKCVKYKQKLNPFAYVVFRVTLQVAGYTILLDIERKLYSKTYVYRYP